MKEEEKKENQQVQGPGHILREERKRRGLSHQDIAEATRLRPSIIKAIENEAWDSLPSPAFARGFLKTYAKALSMDATSILEVYGRKPVLNGELLRVPPEPLRSRRKGPFFLLCIFLAVAVFALWKTYAPKDGKLTISAEKPPVVAEQEKDAAATTSQPAAVQQSAEEQKEAPLSASSPAIGGSAAEERPAPEPVAASTSEAETNPGPQMLKGKVNARTWVKIYVDDLNPREYMFQPGQQPEWTASKGFYLIIGNAGGIDLEWNGRGVTTLGNAGQVVRLSLPEDFHHRVEGN
jgi:cytoskeletal protein RodZ